MTTKLQLTEHHAAYVVQTTRCDPDLFSQENKSFRLFYTTEKKNTSSKPTLFNKSFPPYTSFTYWTAFTIMGLDRSYHAHQFIFSFIF